MGHEDRLARQLQGLRVAPLLFVEPAQIPPGIGGRAGVADGLGDGDRLLERLVGQQPERIGGVGKVRAKIGPMAW